MSLHAAIVELVRHGAAMVLSIVPAPLPPELAMSPLLYGVPAAIGVAAENASRDPEAEAMTPITAEETGRHHEAVMTERVPHAPVDGDDSAGALAVGLATDPRTAALVGSLVTVDREARSNDAQGDADLAASRVPGVFDLVVNGRPGGEAIVLLEGDDVLVKVADLERAGLERLAAPTVTVDGEAYARLAEVAPHEVDLDALEIRIDAPAQALGRSTVDLSPRRPAGLRYETAPSVFINYAPRIVDGVRFEGFAEAGASMGPTLLMGGMTHDPDRGPVRLMTQLIVDDRERLVRGVIGDGFATAGPLGGAGLFGGVTLARSFELDPYVLRVPTLSQTASVTTPGTLEVYVNDSLVRRVPIAPGEIEVANLAPIRGEGTVRYVVRDAYGEEREISSSYYGTAGVLAEGLSDFAYALGFLRRQYGLESFDYGELAFVGRHRHGISRMLTAGARLELTARRQSAGVDLALAPGFGEIDLAIGMSADHDDGSKVGGAALATYGYIRGFLSLTTAVELASADYATTSLRASDDREVVRHNGSASFALPHRMSVGTRLGYGLRRDGDLRAHGGLFFQSALGDAMHLRLAETASRSATEGWQHAFTATLNIALPANHHASLTQRVGSREETSLSVARPIPAPTGLGYRLDAARGERAQVHVAGQARSNHGIFGASYSNVDGESHGVVEGAAALVYVHGAGVFISRPVHQSFAVVHLPGAAGVRVLRDRLEVGETDDDGYLFVPDLRPMHANHLSVRSEDLPLDYEVDDPETLVAPRFRGGAVVTFATRQVRLLRGRVVIETSAGAEEAAHGELRLVAEGEALVSPLGTGGEFELDGVAAGFWPVEVSSRAGRCRAMLRVPASDQLVADVGTVRCRAEPEGAP